MSKSADKKQTVSVRIENIVYQLSVGAPLDLKNLEKFFDDVDKIKKNFPGLKVRIRDPKCTILFFTNGIIHITGLKNKTDITEIESRIRKQMKKIKIDIPESSQAKIINTLVVGDIKKPLNMNRLSLDLENALYEPEVFPGLVYRVYGEVKCTFVLFSTGKFLLLGIKDLGLIPAIVKRYLAFASNPKIKAD
jgi:transcription initiation factor TFIID TATA-box-binding protein